MGKLQTIMATPWDTTTFGLPTYELLKYSAEALQQSLQTAGHHVLKVDPLSNKRLLHEYGFYYCDTLIEPICTADRLRAQVHPNAGISKEFDRERLMSICQGAFTYGRFHRDFNLPTPAADLRYNKWLVQLVDEQKVYGLYWQNELAGFIGYRGNSLVLHALAEDYRGKGFSKYWWSEVCLEMLANGHEVVESSISVSNLAVLNLYVSLGFSFKDPQDVYHRIVP
jgi:hypothetical protein